MSAPLRILSCLTPLCWCFSVSWASQPMYLLHTVTSLFPATSLTQDRHFFWLSQDGFGLSDSYSRSFSSIFLLGTLNESAMSKQMFLAGLAVSSKVSWSSSYVISGRRTRVHLAWNFISKEMQPLFLMRHSTKKMINSLFPPVLWPDVAMIIFSFCSLYFKDVDKKSLQLYQVF